MPVYLIPPALRHHAGWISASLALTVLLSALPGPVEVPAAQYQQLRYLVEDRPDLAGEVADALIDGTISHREWHVLRAQTKPPRRDEAKDALRAHLARSRPVLHNLRKRS